MRFLKLIALTVALTALAGSAADAAGPPIITSGSFDAVTENSATLHALVDPNGVKVKDVHFDYISLADYEAAGNSFGVGTLSTPKQEVPATPTGPQPVSAQISGLTPQTPYKLRAVAENTQAKQTVAMLPDLYTVIPAASFGPCPNDPFRLGPLAPLARPSASLPDCRAYEQASPVDKDGGDVVGASDFVRAAGEGAAGVTFGSAFGVPGGEGAQVLPYYAAMRGEGAWRTRGLLPPGASGPQARVKGWLPDFSERFAEATRLGIPRRKALYELHGDGRAPTQMTAYVPFDGEKSFAYAGASADGGTVLFEAPVALPAAEGEEPLAGALEGKANLFAWEEESGRVHLASVMNTPEETEELLPMGGFTGPYDWMRDLPNRGGASGRYYTIDNNAVSADGSVFFTAAGSGQIYRRLNPTEPQSPLDAEGNCTKPELACTIHVSGSQRSEPDPQGTSPAAFRFASADGSKAFFTSSEELTDDANTGPVQPAARIGRATVDGANPPEGVEEDWLPARARGIAVDPAGEYVYWADPTTNFIGRQKLDSEGNPTGAAEPKYVDTEETEAEIYPEKPNEDERIVKTHSTPRYVAVDSEYVYWTNTGPLVEESGSDRPDKGAGTIGRAKISEPTDVSPEFITGASNPQGIAVNATHIYWANGAEGGPEGPHAIGRATIGGAEVEQEFFFVNTGRVPNGIALSATHLYFTRSGGGEVAVSRIPLVGGKEEFFAFSGGGFPAVDLALVGTNLYWSYPDEGKIGTIPLADFPEVGGCNAVPTCNSDFIEPSGTLAGLAADGSRLFWSVNGETPPNPGNDLYRYEPASGILTDLTPDSSRANGAEVLGVLGGSEDGSRVYAVANGDLDGGGPGEEGDCTQVSIVAVKGSCGLYRLGEGEAELVATIAPGSSRGSLLWAGMPSGLLSSSSYDLRTSWISADGRTLLLYSGDRLTGYDNAGARELYRFEEGEPEAACLSCTPTGAAPGVAPVNGRNTIEVGLNETYPGPLSPSLTNAPTARRILSADGNRAFFESTEALVPGDTNGEDGCPVDSLKAAGICQDVYEWEAPGAGTCLKDGPAYSPLNEGCIYLISTGKGTEPAFLADASPDGSDVYFFTRDQLVGQDSDQLVDVYDARVDGGLAAQNPPPANPCEGESGCRGPSTSPPPFQAPSQVTGPGNPAPKHHKPKPCKKGKKKCKGAKKHGCKKKHDKCKGGKH